MKLRFGKLYVGGFYHVFNRGADRRIVFHDKQDVNRFLLLLDLLNSEKNLRSIQLFKRGDSDFKLEEARKTPLVKIYAYAIMRNHFHLVLEQVAESGVSRFMQKLGTAYSKYYNERYSHAGVIFQGKYKYVELASDMRILQAISYVNLNKIVHSDRSPTSINTTSQSAYLEQKTSSFSVQAQEGVKLFGDLHKYQVVSQEIVKEILKRRALQETDKYIDE